MKMDRSIKSETITAHRVADAEFIPSPNFTPHCVPFTPKGIILHETAGDLSGKGSIAWLCDPKSQVSAHVVIDREGKITQLVPFDCVAWHAGASEWKGRRNLNTCTIGIEFVNPGRLEKIGKDFVSRLAVLMGEEEKREVVWLERAAPFPLAGYFLPFTPAQLARGKGLVRALIHTYPIDWVAGHYQVAPGRKFDPNPSLDMREFERDLGRGEV